MSEFNAMAYLFRRLRFGLERLLIRGPLYQLGFIAILLVLVSLLAGVLVLILIPDAEEFADAAWWAFLRLSDPGYLGDDKGVVRATISTIVTVLGYVLFMGALVAIMTQGLHAWIARLQSGVTPVSLRNHIVVAGWTNRTAAIIAELLVSEGRVRRFLKRVGASELRIAVLADHIDTVRLYDLRDALGPLWKRRKIILRSGNPLRPEQFARVDPGHAAAIIIPAKTFRGSQEHADAQTIKTILSIGESLEKSGHRPTIVAEIFDPDKQGIARESYDGPIEIVPNAAVVNRLIAQNIRHPGLSQIYRELLTHSTGNEIYIPELPELAGRAFGDLAEAFSKAIPLGVLRTSENGPVPHLNPPSDFRIEAGDRHVVMAPAFEHAFPDRQPAAPANPDGRTKPIPPEGRSRRLLILGWNSRAPLLFAELESYSSESFEVSVVSVVPTTERQRMTEVFGIELKRTRVQHVEGDFTYASVLRRIDPARYDNVLFLPSDWMESAESSDARTILGDLMLWRQLSPETPPPRILVELMDAQNEELFADRPDEVLVSPLIISHLLAHVALRPELSVVFDHLFASGGAEFLFRSAESLGIAAGRRAFAALDDDVAAKGEILLGLVDANRITHLNPSRASEWDVGADENLIVLTTYS